MTRWLQRLTWQQQAACAAAALLSICLWLWVITEQPLFMALPFVLLSVALLLVDYRMVYALMLFAVPFSEQIEVVAGLNLDMPTEPLLAIFLLLAAYHMTRQAPLTLRVLRHPLVLIFALQLVWLVITTCNSAHPVASVKFMVQRLWYMGALVIFPVFMLRRDADYRFLLRAMGYALFITLLITNIKQLMDGLDWNRVNEASRLFYINHVVHGCIAVMAIPLFMSLRAWNKQQGGTGNFWLLATFVAVFATIFSYTRASWLAAAMLPFLWVIIRMRLLPLALAAALVGAVALVTWILTDNRYLDFAPDYESTITHKELGNHLVATVEGKDISSMERVYRWVAAKRMIFDKPLLGFGPDAFYPEYFPYSVETYRTYVSDNPEKSTAHNYFMMTAVEQGLPGLVLLALQLAVVLLLANHLYVRSTDPIQRIWLLGGMLTLLAFLFHQLMNDLVEENKLTYIFWLFQGLLLYAHLKPRQGEAALKHASAP